MGFALKLRAHRPGARSTARVERAAAILGLGPYLERYPRQLSGGQRQRVAMGRAIVRDPQVFLFDEPLSNLDAKLRVQMRAEIKELHQRLRTTTVFVTHDQIEAMTMADKIVVMQDGRIEQVGAPLELYDRPANLLRRRVHRLAGDEPDRAASRGAAGSRRRARSCRSRRAAVADGRAGRLRHPARASGARRGRARRRGCGWSSRPGPRRSPTCAAASRRWWRCSATATTSRRGRRCSCGRAPTRRTSSTPRPAGGSDDRAGGARLRRFQHPRHGADGDARGHAAASAAPSAGRACWPPSSAPAGGWSRRGCRGGPRCIPDPVEGGAQERPRGAAGGRSRATGRSTSWC